MKGDAMTDEVKQHPRPGDVVRVEGWERPFAVLDRNGDVYLLVSENGMRIQVRADLIRFTEGKAA